MASSISYHIARNGRVARCKADAGNCPLGGKHFADKQVAKFYSEQGWDQLAEQETTAAKAALQEMPQQELSNRIGVLDTYTSLLRSRNKAGAKQTMQQLHEMGYSKEDQSWNQNLLLGELQRRIAIERATPGSLEHTFALRVEGYKEIRQLGFDEVNRRVTQLERIEEAKAAGNTSLATAYANGFRLSSGYNPESPAWQLEPLKTKQRDNLQAAQNEYEERQRQIKLYDDLADLSTEDLDLRIDRVHNLEDMIERGELEDAKVYASTLTTVYGYSQGDPTWDLDNLRGENNSRQIARSAG